jgi:hypothetical protein
MSEPLTLDTMLAAIGWRVDRHSNGDTCATDAASGALRISDRWGPEWIRRDHFACGSRGPEGAWLTFDEAVIAAYRHHVLGEREAVDPADSTGARCAVYAVEAGPVEDIDAGPHLAHWMVYAEDDFDVIAVDEASAIERVEIEHGPVTGAVVFRIGDDSDGTPDTLPAVDACAS